MIENPSKNSIVAIPARMGSTRFPGKPLALIAGTTMLARVMASAVAAVGVARTFVATCDQEIATEAENAGVRAVMTSRKHERASDRTAEAVNILEAEGMRIDNILMLQGDEPLIPAEALIRIIGRLTDGGHVEIVNLAGPIVNESDFRDENCIKIVARDDGTAMYFSRAPIPHGADVTAGMLKKQVCAIGFSRSGLRQFGAQTEGFLESAESIDMLRWLEHGGQVHLEQILTPTHPVDVVEDIAVVEALLQAANHSPPG